MNWYYKQLGTHTHVRVFMNGAKCGDLCFRNEEFREIRYRQSGEPIFSTVINFIPDSVAGEAENTGNDTPPNKAEALLYDLYENFYTDSGQVYWGMKDGVPVDCELGNKMIDYAIEKGLKL